MNPKEKLAALKKRIGKLALKADLTAEEATELDGMMEEAGRLETQVAALEIAEAVEEEEKQEQQAAIDAAVAAALAKRDEEAAAKGRRLPGGGEAPYQKQFAGLEKYDGISSGDLAVILAVQDSAYRRGRARSPVAENALKALAIRMADTKEESTHEGRMALKAAEIPIKSDEIMNSTLTSYGDEWVGVEYSRVLWPAIRAGSPVMRYLEPYAVVVPQGAESMTLPLEGADPTWYKVSQAADHTSSRPDVTVTASQFVTAKQSLGVEGLGARIDWSGEMEEDSLIQFAPEVRRKIEVSGAEHLESLLIDGDTDTTATTNINHIAGTPGGTEWYLVADGFRKLALVTNTANSRSGGTLDEDDFILTAQLMGPGGKNAAGKDGVGFIVDPNVQWKALQAITALKTQDVYSSPTIENGEITRIWGYPVITTWNMHRTSLANTGYEYKTEATGKIDLGTPSDNSVGSLLCVRFDQWRVGYKRRLTIETDRWIESDTNMIVAKMRVGMIYRDTEAAAISYNLSV